MKDDPLGVYFSAFYPRSVKYVFAILCCVQGEPSWGVPKKPGMESFRLRVW